MTTADSTTPAEGGPVDTDDIDRISLDQALLDVDIANARVIDLTKRLTSLNTQLLNANTELHKLRLRAKRVTRELKAIQESTAYRRAVRAEALLARARARIRK